MGAVSLHRVGVVGVNGPRVGVEVPQHRVVTMCRCRRCRRATTLCRYGASVSMGHGAASVSKGHGAVLLRRVGVIGVDGPRRRVVTARRCRRAMAPCCYAAWVSSVSMGHDAVSLGCVGVDGPRRRVGVEGPRHHVGVEGSRRRVVTPRRRVGVDGPRRRVGVEGPRCRVGVEGPRRRVSVELPRCRAQRGGT
ncbi:hypothetical protein EDB85DRAFT_1886238 [Lactarius pseudohatsudake]|nr:hypothetical protein EDB85DRAFT_1886238 [Lactarius pseudohatsudake]